MGEATPLILWLRQDLRLADNPALTAATETGRPLIVLYILDEDSPGQWVPGGASRWWLGRSLAALAHSLRKRGVRLTLRRGEAGAILEAVIEETGAGAVYWNRCYEPWAIARDKRIKARLAALGREARSFNAALLHEPWTIQTGSGGPFKVFTPFWRAVLAKGAPAPASPRPAGWQQQLRTPSAPMPSRIGACIQRRPIGRAVLPRPGSRAKPVPPAG